MNIERSTDSDRGYYIMLGPHTGLGWVAMAATARKIRRSTLFNLCLRLLLFNKFDFLTELTP